jgi:hypothetical protein
MTDRELLQQAYGAFYTIPPKKEWIGLTDEEYFGLQMKIKTPMISVGDYINAMKMVEAKLKEKNT